MTAPAPENGVGFDELIDYLRRTRGFDFTGYKREGLMRRFRKQMQAVGVQSFTDYMDYLEVHPVEFAALFNAVLINVTTFFRDPESWEFLSQEVLPPLLAAKGPMDPVRVWSAGCATGEEAYTLAIMLAEALGAEQFRSRVKIYATDVDEDALALARQASYGSREVGGIPEPLLAKYFEHSDSRYLFTRELRRNVIFGRNDLMQDAPISRVDLLVCRNTLMYMNAEAQAHVISRFHFALNDRGSLFLGKAEMLFSHATLFQARSLKLRVFSKVTRRGLRDRQLAPVRSKNDTDTDVDLVHRMHILEAAFEAGPAAQMVVDLAGQISLINDHARALFRLSARDLGRPFHDLEISYQPAELRSLIEQAQTSLRSVGTHQVRWAAGGETHYLDIQVMPIFSTDKVLLGVSITFVDVTRSRQLQEEVEEANRELETAYEELQSSTEELETTNEELQSINEELETTNEELQSSNEELETTNEELQSTNEELHTVNDEMRQRSAEMDRLTVFLNSVMAALPGGVVVVNAEMLVQVWSQKAEEMWGIRADEAVGKHFLDVDIGLPMDHLRQPIRACLSGESEGQQITLEAVNRRGRAILCRITCSPLGGDVDSIRDVILVMEEVNGPLPVPSEEQRHGSDGVAVR